MRCGYIKNPARCHMVQRKAACLSVDFGEICVIGVLILTLKNWLDFKIIMTVSIIIMKVIVVVVRVIGFHDLHVKVRTDFIYFIFY